MKTSELTGPALRWAVATCEGMTNLRKVAHNGSRLIMDGPEGNGCYLDSLDYANDWSLSGPIIEREGIGFFRNGKRTFAREEMRYEAHVTKNQDDEPICRIGFRGTGPSPLVAAMRCYVASKLGNEVDIPEELL